MNSTKKRRIHVQKYFIKTYGCQMNVHESEKLSGILEELGYTLAEDIESANVVVFNTCCIRDGVEQKIFSNIGMLKKLASARKSDLIIAVCGCMSQVKDKAEELFTKFPFVNIVFGTHNINDFKEYLLEYKQTRKNRSYVWEKEKDINESVPINRTTGLNAWVNIMYGCNNFCTYCIVPYVRGRERSRDEEDIITEVKMLIAQGYKIITLLGQNVNSYGQDLVQPITFAQLLKELAQLDGDFRIKFLTSHPKDLTDDCIEVIANEQKISKAVHLPIQSGSNNILKAMNRKYTVEHYRNIVDKMRASIKNLALTTDIIVGFPGETDEDFQQTYNAVKEIRYNGVFAFMFSRRKGTVADTMQNQIPLKLKNERVNSILKLSKEIISQQNKELIGKKLECLVIDKKGNSCSGQLDSGKNIILSIDKNVELPSYQTVKVLRYDRKKLYGEIT